MSDILNLKDEIAIVTGGSQGLGESMGKALAQAGATVVLASRNIQKLETVAAKIQSMGGSAKAVKCDISNFEDVQNLVKIVTKSYSKIDILVNNAGMNLPPKPLIDFSVPEWDTVIDANLKGTYFCCKLICPEMIKREKGKIINISSIIGSVALAGMGPYCIAKAGIISLTKVLALELAEHNITVNAIAPGFFDTPLGDNIRDKKDVMDFSIDRTPLGRWGQPEELSGLAVLLSSQGSSYITGQTIFVDGGWTIW